MKPLTSLEDITFLKNLITYTVNERRFPLGTQLPFNILDDLLNFHMLSSDLYREGYCDPITFLKTLQINSTNEKLSAEQFRQFVIDSLIAINPKLLAK